MKVRSKLAVILAAPVCALLVLGGWGATDRLQAADEAADGSRFIELGAAAGALTHELQKEMLLSIGSLSQVVDLTAEELAEQRRATDRAMRQFQGRLADTEPLLGTSGASWRDLRSTGDELAQYREQVDAGIGDPGNFTVFYGRLADAVEGLVADLTTAAASVTPEVAGRLTSLTALTTAKSLFAEQAATLVRVFATHELGDGDRDQLLSQSARYDTQLSVFYATATGGAEGLLRDQLSTDQARGAQRTLDGVLRGEAGSLTGGAATWEQSASAQIDALRQVERRVADALVASAKATASATARDVRLYGAVAIGAVVLALVLALVVARSLTRPLRRLTAAAHRLSRERLPALVDALHRSGGEDIDMELTPIEVDSRDEIGQLADAFNNVQAVTAQVADEQRSLLRKGIGDTFVTLARRNQGLIDRQISFLDELEATEQDPDTLEHLFQLDHLATRMRRNAESLLVLAGVEPSRRRGQPVQLADAVRAAVSEVQDFNRVDLLVLDEGAVDGNVAVDLAHLLAELMENATAFSPPETRVEIVGHLTRDGYVLSVTDQGIGMTDAQIEEANAVLARPPVVGLSLSRSLGFIVVSRLASRSGVGVRLTHSVAGGVTAVVTVPPALLVDLGPTGPDDAATADLALGDPASWSPASEPRTEAQVAAAAAATAPVPAAAAPVPAAAAPVPAAPALVAPVAEAPLPARRAPAADQPAAPLPRRAAPAAEPARAPVTAANGTSPPRTPAQAATDALLRQPAAPFAPADDRSWTAPPPVDDPAAWPAAAAAADAAGWAGARADRTGPPPAVHGPATGHGQPTGPAPHGHGPAGLPSQHGTPAADGLGIGPASGHPSQHGRPAADGLGIGPASGHPSQHGTPAAPAHGLGPAGLPSPHGAPAAHGLGPAAGQPWQHGTPAAPAHGAGIGHTSEHGAPAAHGLGPASGDLPHGAPPERPPLPVDPSPATPWSAPTPHADTAAASPWAPPAPAPADPGVSWPADGAPYAEPRAPWSADEAPTRPAAGPAPEWVPVTTPPASLSEALPGGPDFDRGLAALVADAEAATDPAPPAGPPALPTRQPGATREGPSTPTWATLPNRTPGNRTPAPPPGEGPPTRATARSPEEVRAMLSNYRAGLSRGRTPRQEPPERRPDRGETSEGDEGGRRS